MKDSIARHLVDHGALPLELPWVERGRDRGLHGVELVLASPQRFPWQETVAARQVASFARKADLPGRVTAHSLRKTFTTILGDAGVPLRVIDAVTGHESTGLTLGTYTAVSQHGIERARAAVQEALG